MRGRKAAALLLLFALFAAFSLFKVRLFSLSPGFDPSDDTAFFWSESAFQYRYAKMAAEGVPIPETDTAAQFPEGARPRSEFTLGMELLSGGLYRLLFGGGQGPPFHVWLTWFISFYTSLTLLSVYALGLSLGGGRAGALLAALLYVSARISWARTVNGFNYEDFALPLLFGGLAFFIGAMREEGKKRAAYSALSALLTAAALAGWHFSRFYLLVFAAAAAAVLLARRDGEKALPPLAALLAASIAAALTVPVLRASGFLLSPPMAALAALTAALALRRAAGFGRLRAAGAFLLALAAIGAAAFLLSAGDGREYSHVYSLFLHKAANLLSKPADPSLLPFEVRALWVEALDTPSPADWLKYLSVLLPLALPAFVLRARAPEESPDPGRVLLLWLTAAFLLLNLFAIRIFLFSAFLLALWTCVYPGLLSETARRRGRGRAWGLAAVALSAAFGLDFAGFLMNRPPSSPPTFYRGDVKRLVEWARAETADGEVFLGNLGASAALLAYAGRPTAINPKFETAAMRGKFEKFALALYGGEEDLWRLCREYGADYFVHENHFVLDSSKKSFRYLANALSLDTGSAAYSMQFRPGRLKLFAPAHQTSTFRVYRVLLAPGRERAAGAFPHHPMYDEEFFGNAPGAARFDDAGVMRAALRLLAEKGTVPGS